MRDINRLLTLLRPLLPHMALTVLLGTLGYLSITGISVVGGMAVIQGAEAGHYGSMRFLLEIIIVSGIARAVFRLSEQYCTHYIAFRLLAIIRDRIFTVIRSLGPQQLKDFRKGEFMNIVTKDVEMLEVFYAHTVAPVCIGLLTTVVYVSAFSFLHPLYGAAALASYVFISYLVPMAVYRYGREAAETYRSRYGQVSDFLMDSLKGIKELVVFGQKKKTIERIEQFSAQLNDTSKRLKEHEGLLKALTDCTLYVAVFSNIAISLLLVNRQSISAAEALLSILLLFSSFGPSLALSHLSASLVHTFASAKRVLTLMDLEIAEKPEGSEPIGAIDTIECAGLSFGYRGKELLYEDIHMKWERGRIIGIKGKNGTGKSTLISLMLREMPALSGEILFNGRPASVYSAESLREQFSTVDASTFVFSDTLRRNLTMFKQHYTDQEIMAACSKAGLTSFVESMPEGLDSYVQEYAANISSGQLQRIAMARLFLRNTPVYILDEPTSNLDSLNERYILQKIKENSNGKIVVIISHNDAVLKMADRVYQIQNRRVNSI
ncbi:amino acid ABC transporter ATP-binding/permease protein [Bacillus testis]|uniref:amino acid ABC transporter ATP-binding/permease protein n=1 Tax=Bacillus testis TaxID=1622072 RepID=UPI00067F24B4|nr:ABC transporter ATP-binding protein [Bacillus testis]